METNEEKLPAVKPAIGIGPVSGGLVPTTFDGLYRMAQIMSASGMMPKGIERPEAVFVAVQMGLEIGLSPMQAVQNIAVINGRPSLWGDSVLGLVRASGKLERFSETIDGIGDKMVARCVAKRRGEPDEIIREFSVDDAKKANLWGKAGPWQQYPKRMLQMRARSWALRDGFGDVIKGLRVAEEVMDYDIDMQQQGGTYEPAPSAAPEPDPFHEAVKNHGINADQMSDYLQAAAKKYGTTPERIMAGAMQTETAWLEMLDDFKEFWRLGTDTHRPSYTGRNSYVGREGADPNPKQQPDPPAEKAVDQAGPKETRATDAWDSEEKNGNWWDFDGGRNWKYKRGNTIDHLTRIGLGLTKAKRGELQEDFEACIDDNPGAIGTLTAATKETRAAVRAKFEGKFGAAAADELAELAKSGAEPGKAEPEFGNEAPPADEDVPPETDAGETPKPSCYEQLNRLEKGFPEHYKAAIKKHGAPQSADECKAVIMAISLMVDRENDQ